MALFSVSVFDSCKHTTILPWTIFQEEDERETIGRLYGNVATKKPELAGYSVTEIRVGSSKDSLDIVGDSGKQYSSYVLI